MSTQEATTVARETCPCGAGKVSIVLTYVDTDWGIRDQDWHGEIACERCAPVYTFVRAGRGAYVVTIVDKARCDLLREQAVSLRRRLLASSEVETVLEQLAERFEALPSIAARYRLVVQLKLETATEATFRRHMRGSDMRRWLRAMRDMRHLPALFAAAGASPARLDETVAQAAELESQAGDALRPVMSLGPISLFARPREEA